MIPRRANAATRAPSSEPPWAERAVLAGCRRYVASHPSERPAAAADAELMVASLRWLEQWLEGRRVACLEAVAAGITDESPMPPLGVAARALVEWVRAHPRRACEPLEWLVQDMLDHAYHPHLHGSSPTHARSRDQPRATGRARLHDRRRFPRA